MRHVWLTDCKRLHDHLTVSSFGKTEDKRLSIDLMSLRQDLWAFGGEDLDALHPTQFGDKVRWIDTRVMAVDCLTKTMPSDFLANIQRTNVYDLTPDPSSTAKKVKKQTSRAKPEGCVREKILGGEPE